VPSAPEATFHILSQFVWPDDAPTGIYAEHVADGIRARGSKVRLVSGTGSYRRGSRLAPASPIERQAHHVGGRGNLLMTMAEYLAVSRAFRRYIERNVSAADVVIVTSAPPTTIFLHSAIRRRKAVSVYWLQDYYPQLVRGMWDPPAVATRALSRLWDHQLQGWDHVVKAAGNLAYSRSNSRVIRNWPTIEFRDLAPAQPATALYSGNLGYGHDLRSFLDLCGELRHRGYAITVRGDGPKMQGLPDWIERRPPCMSQEELVAAYERSEIHLIAGDPRLPEAVFPSKVWNSLAARRRIIVSGFVGAMQEEWSRVEQSDFRAHLPAWIDFAMSLTSPAAGRS
jgi:hypothetical protein